MKKVFLLFLLALVSTSASSFSYTVANAVDGYVDEGYIPPDLPIQGMFYLNFKDGRISHPDVGAPYLSWSNSGYNWNGTPQALLCTSLADKQCHQESGSYEFFTRLSTCDSATALDCIESIKAERSGTTYEGKFVEVFPKKNVTSYVSDESIRLPKASSGGFWKFAGLDHPGGNDYFISAMLRGKKDVNAAAFTNSALNITINAASKAPLGLHTTSPEFGSVIDDGSSFVVQRYGKNPGESYFGSVGIYGGYENEKLDCVMSGDGFCANRHAIPADTKFTISVRLSSSPSGWLHGRLDEPNIEIKELSPSPAINLTISGLALRVPAIGAAKKWRDLPKTLQTRYLTGPAFNPGSVGCRWCSEDPLKNTFISNPPVSGEGSLAEISAWLPLVGDKSSADINTWSIRTLKDEEMSGANQCFKESNRINGVVMTNSTVYSAGPPEFIDGALNYKVAAPHFMTNGEVFKGRYNLVMRSDVARCVYKFSQAPIKASVSVVSSDGQPQVATMVMGERNGWLYLAANNFEFSSPTVRIKLGQDAAPAPAPEVTTQADAKSPAKKSTITCAKGNAKKKVTGVNPKCPSGYKKAVK